jgi:glycosyltransferase involved in cell wall biosynthesis
LRAELAARCPGLRFLPDPGADGVPWRDVGLLCLTTITDDAFYRALEAMAHGVPVVGFASQSLMRLVRQGENGWLINPGNLAAMARIIDRWETLDERARRALSDGARATVAEQFAPRRALTTILSVYARAVARDDFTGQH